MIGHNADVGVAVHSDDQPTLFHYVQWHIGDYKEGTANMTLEIEGAYMRFLMQLYGSGKPLPDDDLIMAKRMGTVTRVWRRIKEMLISVGKIIARNGCLTNARFERERLVRAEEIKNRSAAATARWRKGSRKTVEAAVQGDCNGVTNRMQSPNDRKKINKINETALEVHMLTNNHKPITIEKENPGASESVAAVEPLLPQIEGFNGATTLMVTKIAKWMNPNAPAYAEARQWLVNTAQIYGNEVVRDAFAAMEAKAASGDIVGRPLVFMTKTCQGKKRDLDEQKQQKQDMAGLQNMSEAARKKILADRERAKKGENMLWT